MVFTNFNPPFTNKNLDQFFDFENEYQEIAIFFREYILNKYVDLDIGLSYHVPFFYLNKKKLFYFHYTKIDEKLFLEISFIKGSEIKDIYNLFQDKNKKTKSILLKSKDKDFLQKIDYYISNCIELN